MEKTKYYMKAEEVAMRLGVSIQTLNRWYAYKRKNPDSDFAQKLPEYALNTTASGKVRLWTEDGLWQLLQFKCAVKVGRTGKMGQYGGTGTNGKKERRRKTVNA